VSGLLHRTLQSIADAHGDVLAVEGAGGPSSYRELLQSAESLAREFGSLAGARVGVALEATAPMVSLLVALDSLRADVFLMSGQLDSATLGRLADELHLDGVLGAPEQTPAWIYPPAPKGHAGNKNPKIGESEGSVTLLTSGTTGVPKAVRHVWASLMRPVRTAGQYAGTRWLLPYPMHLYAGIQVFLQCCVNGATLVPLPAAVGPTELGEFLREQGVQYVSGTPSFWRKLLLFTPKATLHRLPLVQITLGGEAVTEDLMAALAEAFPRARLVHVYATSELGRCFSVTDRHAGFPASYLEDPPEPGVSLRIVDGELLVRSANAMRAYDPLSGLQADMDEWFPTGDLVSIEDERVYFSGRRSDIINVGGNKVLPLDVERAVREVPGVADVRVFPVRSSIVGEVVGADVVPSPGTSSKELQARLVEHCLQRLQPFQRPRTWRFVDSVRTTESGKVRRREVSQP